MANKYVDKEYLLTQFKNYDGDVSEKKYFDNYSFEEKKVGVWVDNKPMYQCSFEYADSAQSGDVVLDPDDLDIDTLIGECQIFPIDNTYIITARYTKITD